MSLSEEPVEVQMPSEVTTVAVRLVSRALRKVVCMRGARRVQREGLSFLA